jgi:hypothetical protein
VIKNIEVIVKEIKRLKIQFKRGYLIGYPMIWCARCWVYFYRVRPFTYVRGKSERNIYSYVVFSLIMFILALVKIMVS